MVRIFSKDEASEKASYYACRCNWSHNFEVRPYQDGFAVVQTDSVDPHYLCTNGSFWPINQ